ncbi:MAG: hypothetical protein LBU58_10955, partial [Clostridiales bacterium]|nr:hypothetical protein [Clostridiales bacterium]
ITAVFASATDAADRFTEDVARRHGIDSALRVGQPVFVSWLPRNAVIVEDSAPAAAATAVRTAAAKAIAASEAARGAAQETGS